MEKAKDMYQRKGRFPEDVKRAIEKMERKNAAGSIQS